MSWEMHEKEFESVMSLTGAERYTYLIKRVADWEKIWSLRSEDGWALASDSEGHELVPVWPHEKFALACVSGEWSSCKPEKIALNYWLDRWIPGITKDQRVIAVFPDPSRRGVVVTPQKFKEDLEKEIELYE